MRVVPACEEKELLEELAETFSYMGMKGRTSPVDALNTAPAGKSRRNFRKRLSKFSSSRPHAMKLQGMIRFAAGTPLALVMAAYILGQNAGAGPDLLDKRIDQLAGPNAVNCGRVSPRDDPKSETACALAAHKAGKPFRVRYDMQGIDSFVAAAFVRLPDGSVQALNYDSDPFGGGGRAHEMVRVTACPAPIQLHTTPEGHLTCFPPNPPAP
jgi:hypothetical protein